MGSVIAGHQKVIGTSNCFPGLDAMDLLSVPWMPRVVNRQQIAIVRSV